MNREDKLTAAEFKYKNLLEDFFINTWGSTVLYSHDIDHHRRVWKYARELLLTTGDEDIPAENILIASYLHDIGMATDRGQKHGSVSMDLCRSFLAANKMDPAYYSDVLDAIEKHDDKEYKNPDSNYSPLLKILSAADDLDAFGYIGVYRYLEIYIARGIDTTIIGHEILRNASGRFANFESGFGMYPALIEIHRSRYLVLHDFMKRHISDLQIPMSENEKVYSLTGVVSLVSDLIRYKLPPLKISSLSVLYNNNNIVRDFVEGLTKELSMK